MARLSTAVPNVISSLSAKWPRARLHRVWSLSYVDKDLDTMSRKFDSRGTENHDGLYAQLWGLPVVEKTYVMRIGMKRNDFGNKYSHFRCLFRS